MGAYLVQTSRESGHKLFVKTQTRLFVVWRCSARRPSSKVPSLASQNTNSSQVHHKRVVKSSRGSNGVQPFQLWNYWIGYGIREAYPYRRKHMRIRILYAYLYSVSVSVIRSHIRIRSRIPYLYRYSVYLYTVAAPVSRSVFRIR